MKPFSLEGLWNLKAEGTIYNTQNKLTIPNTVQFPGDIQSAILKENPTFDPYFGKNELSFQTPGQTYWTCTKIFTLKSSFIKNRQFLELDGVDTFTEIFLNGNFVGKTENFFRKWRFEISDFLKEGENEIVIKFTPSEAVALEESKKLTYPIPCTEYDVTSPNRNLVRKTQCHSGWDWGPCIMAMGIYNSIKIVTATKGFLDYIQTSTKPVSDNVWQVELKISFNSFGIYKVPVCVEIPDTPKPILQNFEVSLENGENQFTHTITVENPELWWPFGCRPEDDEAILQTGKPTGNQNKLYNLTVTVANTQKSQELAFRTLETVSKEDEYGKSLYFNVNGRSIFAKGSNWIPSDALPSRQTNEKYSYLLQSLIQANQNIIRVWGGGMYEKDYFYHLCDLYGILVWQDCMFACSTYPATKDFLDNVRQEIRHQVRRLSHHACIALWCGNNENLGAITWYEESRKNRDRYLIDYDRLNEGTVGDEVCKNDPERAWWPSSPSAGPNDFSDNWHSDGRGDMHYWSVWHEKKPFEAYYDIRPRFVSEFGYESLPSYSEVKTFAPKDDLNLTSPIMEFHQRSIGGNSIIFENFSRYFRVPVTFKQQIYLSQVQQAIAIQTAVQYWRSLRPVCMGAIIWQLNDVWPIASWSSIDYSGKWKLLHYNAQKFFAPIFLSAFIKNKKLYVYVLNDTRKQLDSKITIQTIDFAGFNVKDDLVISSNVKPDSSTLVYECDYENPVSDSFLNLTLNVGEQKYSTTVFTDLQKKCYLQNPKIKSWIEQTKDPHCVKVVLCSEKPAFYVSLDSNNVEGHFSDNMFTLLPNEQKIVYFTSKLKGNSLLTRLNANLEINSLYSSYN